MPQPLEVSAGSGFAGAPVKPSRCLWSCRSRARQVAGAQPAVGPAQEGSTAQAVRYQIPDSGRVLGIARSC